MFDAKEAEYKKTISRLEQQSQSRATLPVRRDQPVVETGLSGIEGRADSFQSRELCSVLESMKTEKAKMESQLESLKECLVVNTDPATRRGGAKGDDEKYGFVKIEELYRILCEAEKSLEEQNRAHLQAVTRLQDRLNREVGEKQQLSKMLKEKVWGREEEKKEEGVKEVERERHQLRQEEHLSKEGRRGGGGGRGGVEQTSAPDMTRQLQEKDAVIADLENKLQRFEETAVKLTKITRHSKDQSRLIEELKTEFKAAKVRLKCG